jgi:D-3-phosphoglycerate dehydrogenase
MGKYTAVYIDGLTRNIDGDIEREVLAARDIDLVVAGCTDDDEVVEVAVGAPAILNTMYWMDRSLFERLPDLKVVVRGGVGVDNLDVDAATDCGIVVCNVIDYGYNEVANHAFAMLLALNRNLVALDRSVHGQWASGPSLMPHTGRMAGETLGLVSLGTIARAVARRAAGFDMRVIAFDPFVDPADARAAGVELLPLDDVLGQADYLSIHTPLVAATRGLIGARELALMKPNAYVVLTSRGGIIDEAALADAVREGRIAGAGIDVWDGEPVDPSHPLLQLDNVIGSPHAAWYSQASIVELRQRFAETAADVLHGIMPPSLVNPSVLDRVSLRPRDEQGDRAGDSV